MKIGFIGAGQMAQALAEGISASHAATSFLVADPSEKAIEAFTSRVHSASVETADANADVFAGAEMVFLAVKPQFFEAAISAVPLSASAAAPVVVSIMAGVSIAAIQQRTGISQVVRVMPNTPCLVGAGACGMACADEVSDSRREQIKAYLETTGIVIELEEKLLDAVTGLSGSGPAYIFELIDAMALGGVKCGLPRGVADQLAAQTVLGAARLAIESGEHPSALRDRVTSPGGTTIAGLKALLDNGFQQATIAAIEAATNRSKELGSS